MKPLLILLLFCYTSSFSVNIYGHVFCAGSKIPVINAVVSVKAVSGKRDKCYTDSTGFFSIEVESITTTLSVGSNEKYRNNAGAKVKKYFRSDKYIFHFSKDSEDTALTVDLEVVPQNTGISLTIYFKKDSVGGKDVSSQIQDRLVVFKDNPSIRKIEIVGYTSKLEDKSLRSLRAQEIHRQILAMKIPLEGITINNSKPNNPKYLPGMSCSKEPHQPHMKNQLNQKVEIIITKISKE
ncbi:MAG: hypothetical protein ACJAZ2_000145 [Glaciecola sp.]|jgi:hypothetical protein